MSEQQNLFVFLKKQPSSVDLGCTSRSEAPDVAVPNPAMSPSTVVAGDTRPAAGNQAGGAAASTAPAFHGFTEELDLVGNPVFGDRGVLAETLQVCFLTISLEQVWCVCFPCHC